MALSLVPGTALATVEDACAPAPEENFSDVPEGGTFEDEIECLAGYNIVLGYDEDNTFRPGLDVTRAQATSYIVGLIETAQGSELEMPDDNPFEDVDADDTFYEPILKLVNIGVIQGTGDAEFSPLADLSRGQMAQLVAEALEYLGAQLDASDHDANDDVDEDDTFGESINELLNADVIQGFEDGNFHGQREVTRGQLAGFAAGGAGELDDQGSWAPTAEEQPTTNQTFMVTGDGDTAAINTVSVNVDPNQNRGTRTYTFNVADATTVDIALIPADEVTIDDNGVVTFGDNEGAANQADNLGDAGGAVIETVNGVDVADDDYINNVTVTNGTVSFSVDSETPNITVRPVVFDDADNDNQLDLVAPATANNDAKQPTEDFGVGGTKQWIRTEAQSGTPVTGDALIELVNKDANFFSTQDGVYNYDANDQFRVATDDASTCVPVSMATFEENLSRNDELEDEVTIYSRDEEASSVFCINDVAPAQVTGVTATAVDEDTIRVAWTDQAGVDSYNIYRTQDTTPGDNCPATASSYTLVANDAGTPYEDNGLQPDTKYCYQVSAVDDGDEGQRSAIAETAAARTSPAGTTAAPQSDDARLITDGGFVGEADSGDEWRVLFSEPIENEATAIIRVQDGDGEFENVQCGAPAEAVCSTNNSTVTIGGQNYAAGRVLTIAVGAIGTPDGDADANAANNDDALQYPLTITTQSGITDATGNVWTPADDPDNVIDDEGTQTVTQVAPTFTSTSNAAGNGVNPDTVDANYSEAVTDFGVGGYDPGQFFYDADCTAGGDVAATGAVQGDADTITLTFAEGTLPADPTPDSATDCIRYVDDNPGTPDNGDVVDLDGNEQPTPDTVTVGQATT